MFLSSLARKNPEFLEAVAELHRRGHIPPASYVLDIDRIEANSRIFCEIAHGLGMEVLPMTKQIGRARPALDAMVRGGADGFVAVDMEGARAITGSGHRLGHLGHLVQVARSHASEAAAMHPDVWTVFSFDKAREVSAAAGQQGRMQDVLARIHAPGDTFYPGHEGGFAADAVVEVAERLNEMPHLRFVGITTFPALLFDTETRSVKPTPNLNTLERARNALENAGFKDLVINAPGTTSTAVLDLLATAGATQVEPGHGLTATTPLHAVRDDLPEMPAVCYLSEVSHFYEGRAYFFGGGLYIDPVFSDYQVTALAGSGPIAKVNPLPAALPPPSMIDYYGQLYQSEGLRTGDTVILGFRMQAFFTRAFVVPVSGVSSGKPVVEGIWTGDGRPVALEGLR